MQIQRFGIVVFCERYDECVRFYRDTLGLELVRQEPTITAFAIAGGYLLIEPGGSAGSRAKTRTQNPTILRFDVPDVHAAAARCRAAGADVEVRAFDWGTIGVLYDPDGNRCEFKNAE